MSIAINNSLANYLKLLQPKISPHLIAPQYWHNIETVARVLPSAITTFFGFECRLGIEKAHADFLICADAQELGRKILANDQYSITLPADLYAHPVWQQIHNFSEQWNNQDSPLYDGINNIWLEFDIDESPVSIPVPSCFFGPQAIYSGSDSQWTINTALKLLQNRDVPQVIATKLLNCFELLPDDAYIFQIGVMLARKSDLVRVCIRNISPEEILKYLAALNWSGSIDALHQTLNKLSSYATRIDLDIDIGESILPKIGLECYLDKQPKFEPKWQLFLDYLTEVGFCTSQKRDSLLAYPGYIRGKQSPDFFPNNLERISSFLGSGYEGVFFKGLHHIKVTYQESASLEAKAYLYINQQLINPKFADHCKTWKNPDQLISS
jgi:hypothetical protein